MSQTAPPHRDSGPGEPDERPDDGATSPILGRDWRRAVTTLGATVADAAVDAVTVVGDAARTLATRTRSAIDANGETSTKDRTSPLGNGTANGNGTAAGPTISAPSSSTVADATAGTAPTPPVTPAAPSDPDADTGRLDAAPAATVPVLRGADAPTGTSLDEATVHAPTPVAAPTSRNGDAPSRDEREVAWLPPLREREETERSWLVRASWFVLATLAGLAAIIVAAVALLPLAVSYAAESADAELILPADTTFGSLDQRSRVYADDGETLLAILHGEQDRNPVSLERMPDHVWQAVVAAEDQKFFEHTGYDPAGIVRAAIANVEAGGVEQGGSTISQQVARLNFSEVGTARSIDRKLKEVIYAVALEERFTKEQILDRYVNQVYFGSGAYGMQAASEEFFDANVVDLTVDQAALLSALISSPSAYNPRIDPEAARVQRDLVIDSMADVGYITPAEAVQYQQAPIEIAPPSTGTNRQPSIIEAVIDEFKRNPLFGATRQEREDLLFTGGLRITTTLDPELQALAEQTIEQRYPPSDDAPTAVIGAIDPTTGAIKVAASAEEYNRENFNLALLGRKQPGSAAKPLVMAAALQQGFPPDTALEANGSMEFQVSRTEVWPVSNFGGASYGRIDMRTATQKSVNTYYAQLIQLVGLSESVDMMDSLGVDTRAALGGPSERGFAITLGGWTHGATAIEMANAYGTFANNGIRNEPYLLAEVRRGGEDLLQRERRQTRVLEPGVNAVALNLLRGPVGPGGTASVYLPNVPIIGKTGTTNSQRAAWFVGATPRLTTAVWVAHPGEARSLPPGTTGGGTAAPVWQAFMSEALAGAEPVDFPDAEEADFVGEEVNVPAVYGLSEAEALARLADAKLIGSVQYQASGAPTGTVIWASPSDQANVGSTVYVGVSTGSPPPPPEPEPEPEPEESQDQDPDDGDGEAGAAEAANDLAQRIRDQIRDRRSGNGTNITSPDDD